MENQATVPTGPDFRVIFSTLEADSQTELLEISADIARQADAIRELTSAIEEVDNTYFPSFLSA